MMEASSSAVEQSNSVLMQNAHPEPQPQEQSNASESHAKKSNPGVKKKELRRQRWMEKRKAANLPIETTNETKLKNREKTLDEWLDLPRGYYYYYC